MYIPQQKTEKTYDFPIIKIQTCIKNQFSCVSRNHTCSIALKLILLTEKL